MKGTGAKSNVCPGSCVSTGAKFPVAPVQSAPVFVTTRVFPPAIYAPASFTEEFVAVHTFAALRVVVSSASRNTRNVFTSAAQRRAAYV